MEAFKLLSYSNYYVCSRSHKILSYRVYLLKLCRFECSYACRVLGTHIYYFDGFNDILIRIRQHTQATFFKNYRLLLA